MNSIDQQFTDKLYANYEATAKYAAIENAVSHNGLLTSLEKRSSAIENNPVFSIDLTKDKVSNQKASGRCWMFAALNTFRHKMIAGFQLEEFELSQAHTFFWDKYEKSNWFLEQVLATADKPYGKSYTVEMLGNVVGARDVRYLNVNMERLKELAIAQMQAGETVWFGSDVGQSSNRKAGVMVNDMYDFTSSMDIELTQDKAGRLDYSESLMTHAMVLTGVDLDENGKSTKWKVENSWGDKVGDKGYFVASDDWMDEYTYQIVVRKEFLTAEELAAYEAEPKVLAPWDPMGALASK